MYRHSVWRVTASGPRSCADLLFLYSVAQQAGSIHLVAQHLQFCSRRRLDSFNLLGGLDCETGVGTDVIDADAGKKHCKPRFERFRIKIENALRRHDPFRPIAVVLVLSTDLFAWMGNEIDLLNQAPLVVRGKKHIRVAHADSDIVNPDRPRSPECHFAGFSQADHVGVAPFIRLDAANKKFVREPEVIDVAQVTAFLVVPFAPRRPVEQIRIRMIMHGFGVAEELVAGRCLRQLAHVNVSHIAQHHAAASTSHARTAEMPRRSNRREWDGPAVLPPLTAHRVSLGLSKSTRSHRHALQDRGRRCPHDWYRYW